MEGAPPHANCGVFPAGTPGWLVGLVSQGSSTLEIPPANHPFWRGSDAPAHALHVFAQQEAQKLALGAQLKDALEAKAATSSAVEWLQASNKKLTEKAAVTGAEAGRLRQQLSLASASPSATRAALEAQTKEAQALRDELQALLARHEDLLEVQADTEEALLEAHTLLEQRADPASPPSRARTPTRADSRAPTPLGADAALRSLHSDLRAAREAASVAEARARVAEEQWAASTQLLAAAQSQAPSPLPPPSPSPSSDAALAAARSTIGRLESQLESANRLLARSKGAVAGVDGAVDAGTYALAESEACEARAQAAAALTKLDWSTSRIKALTAALEDEKKQGRARELKLASKIDVIQASRGSPSTRPGESEASLRAQLREARAAADASRARVRALEQRVFALERRGAELQTAAAALGALNLTPHDSE